MTAVTILQEAEDELRDAVDYYEKKASGLGLDLAVEIERALQTIAEHPGRWPLRHDGTRRYLAYRFPYIIVYSYENDRVWVLAFAHCRQKPSYWNNRTRPSNPDSGFSY